ncbi:carbon-nitrogen hydrolase family protein [Aeromicrobium sp. YIM 150415]|uniref:carbon-nitrogen hydrolase family protein n=1 Tax=Aeromicrobium sp. YIM 150415 TaxID=2803912 RepID=UPI00196635CB|nr:carbon-nitrogen hydrolase family protein [Aeromicrobium sp. YIM 150415]MBM9463703.1 carbon-nitrogen hydrolase family protein [Aeromicrobium sp. YIM 150415]
MSTVRLGLAQTMTHFGDDEERNLENAVALIEHAARQDIDLLAFAENYPGPFTESNRYEVDAVMAESARTHGVAVAYGTSRPAPGRDGSFHITTVIVDSQGVERGAYHRTHPEGPYIYRDGKQWNFDYVAAEAFPVVDMGWGKLAVSICSEVHLPEVSRILALKGAEIILYPSGLLIDELGYTENWRTLVRARAIENHAYTATLVNLMDPAVGAQFNRSGVELAPPRNSITTGIGGIYGPERVLAESGEPGLLTADLDLDRIRYLRAASEELIVPAPYRTIPGHMTWRRPELYGELTRPRTR